MSVCSAVESDSRTVTRSLLPSVQSSRRRSAFNFTPMPPPPTWITWPSSRPASSTAIAPSSASRSHLRRSVSFVTRPILPSESGIRLGKTAWGCNVSRFEGFEVSECTGSAVALETSKRETLKLRTTRACPLLRQNQLGDRAELHVAGAFVDLADLGVAIVLLHRIVLGEAVAAVDLDRQRRYALGHL